MRTQPKKNLSNLSKPNNIFGNEVRKSYQKTILNNAPIFPKTLEYNDIDKAVFEFVDNIVDITIDGKLIPTYTLYSNQRFSEYSQMWEHSDEFGNLYLNFKTINREKNPKFGENQGGYWNIPGNRKYTLLQREVLEDNGTECYEVYSMKQPYTIDLMYTVNFVTTTFEYLNQFNQKINKIFASRQYYIRPNGHFIPMLLETIEDETSYSISERKFYVQAVSIRVMAYIIEEKDFEITKYPKRTNLAIHNDIKLKKSAYVEIEEENNDVNNQTINVNMNFKPFINKTSFVFDTEMVVESVYTENVRNIRVMVNDDLYYTDKGFKLHTDDNVIIKITPIEEKKYSVVKFIGYNPNVLFKENEVLDDVNNHITTHLEKNLNEK